MPEYKAPLRDMRFLTDELFDFPATYTAIGASDASPDMVAAILEEGAKFCEQVLSPLNRSGDEEECQWKDGVVTTPKGFKEAFAQYVEGGWNGLSADPTYGGQGLPHSLGLIVSEMVASANQSWAMYPGLTHGAMSAIHAHGSEEQKQTYLTRLTEGRWTGTMCLTEPHCGTDLGIIKTRAVPQADGSYAISGTKIFISAGEHDMSENIVHLVLAKLPDAPAGTKGISLFIVPKFLPRGDGIGERNAVSCGSIEHKMGIKASATCVMNFDSATGFLIGEANKGLNCMFTMMNHARLGTGMQGLCLGEASYQGAVRYATERLQMRALTGPKAPDKPADPIIVHPDVRRMLLTMRAFNEGNRALAYFTAQQLDIAHGAENAEEREQAENLLAFLTPICKAFMTETGLEATNLGMQVFGGHGYIREWGMEQLVRDCRIAPIYEGTNGIQALDLLGRKVLGSQGKLLTGFTKRVHQFCQAQAEHPQLKAQVAQLADLNRQWGELTQRIGMAAMKNPDEVGAASVDYLMYSGYIVLAYFWLQMAVVARQQLDAGTGEAAFYEAKLLTCDFYFKRLLPRTAAHKAAAEAGSDCLMALSAEQFAL
ncbi:acyl-CoA dehydrogenase C-terminal domain-containing protein [Pseudomonas otitidis]|uniref:Acyl-CoA dehydrogenase C-terminal domain-containing protein n=1 Tax=Metapseudomonas otitidis TaxID=319939 RepID=A0ABU3XY28_9GAMM|nr:acyl-CoA dehydrogenase C-terminal domain-containing protein [Pseudomonas otitidis]MDH1108367.1 acyl-CoA dehydrogenase C-terminal domain-containing protein [Pseudomonas otitidis]MDH1157861.1 acyl-CoA dehydrogenase C-terminal domain-containing protein [Pseudomonas otitidis]MDH1166363.1 acyl-CoA dehydrogenase C-terminal domain-containing protein [Pseudomonas otitidis]MDV3442420.1 acyl-CoA dehydrogenase C-terminal domain-containing protein [Pseudomonas otitidis]MEE1894772.1 acyl-CoA dehydrogena